MFLSFSLSTRGNRIYDENSLKSLNLVSNSLRTLVISENPLEETIDYRISTLVLLPRLERIDKDAVSQEERADAQKRIRVRLSCDLSDKPLHSC